MTPDELLAQRVQRCLHHVNAIQRLMSTTVVCVCCVDADGRPNLIVNPEYEIADLRQLLFAFAVKEFIEA